jgi:hypothetical protein
MGLTNEERDAAAKAAAAWPAGHGEDWMLPDGRL